MRLALMLAALLLAGCAGAPAAKTERVAFVLENMGVGGGFTGGIGEGKLFLNDPPGTITQVCAYLQGGSGELTWKLAHRWRAFDEVARGTIVAGESDGWRCSDVSIEWSGEGGVFVHKLAGSAAVSFDRVDKGGDMVYFADGCCWEHDHTRNLGYTVTMLL